MPVFLHYGVGDQTELFRLSLVLEKMVDYLVAYPKVSDNLNLQDKTKRLLSFEKFMQISANPKLWFNPKVLAFLLSHSNDFNLLD